MTRPEPSVPAPSPTPDARPRWARRVGLAALLCGLVLLAYWPALRGGFIWDDTVLLTESPLIHAPDGLYRLWFTTEAPDYWPLTSTTFWLEWRLWGLHPTGYHLTNLALHAAEALLLWVILGRLGIGGAFLAALVFAVHPVNVESVAWIAQRKNLVALLFFLLAVLFYVESDSEAAAGRARRPVARRWYGLSLAMFVLAMLGKGSVAPLPLILLLIAWWRRRRVTVRDFVRVLPFAAIAGVLVLVNIWFQTHGTGPIRHAGLAERLLGAGAVVWFYLYKALLPLHLSFVYPQWHVDVSRPLWWIPLAATVAVSVALWRYRGTWGRPFFFAWCFFCLALLPVMGLTDVYFMTFSLVADHYQHIALIGVVALAAAGWNEWRRRLAEPLRPVAVVAATVAVAALTGLTVRRSAIYESAETLYRATIDANPGCWLAQYNLAVDLEAQGRREEAFAHLEEAVRIKPDYAEAHNNLALALSGRGRSAEALSHAEQAVRIKPDLAQARVNLGILLNKGGRPAEALPHLERAVKLSPGSSEAHHNFGLALAALGRLPEAIVQYHEAVRLDPGSAEGFNALGTGLLATGRFPEACSALEQALRLDPGYAEALGNLGLALVRSGRPREAVARYEEALRLRPDYPEAHYNLGTLLAGAGRTGDALVHYEQALRIRPDYAEAHNNMAVLLAGAGRTGEALAHLEEAVRIKPGFLDARLNLAEISARAGRFPEAVAQARAALELVPPADRPALERKMEAWRSPSRAR